MGNPWHKQAERVKRLNQGVKGVHVCIPFQCEVCWIRNLEGRDVLPGGRDEGYLMTLRRANLDAMAGKAKSTISKHVAEVKMMVKNSLRVGKTPTLPPRGPFPLKDEFGMGLAVDMLQRSITSVGKIEKFIQFETVRKTRSTYSSLWQSSPDGIAEGASFAIRAGKIQLTSCPSQSVWFSNFIRGCEDRMGYETRANKAVVIEVIVAILDMI